MEPAPEMPKPAEEKKAATKKQLKPTTIIAVVFIVFAFGFFTYMAAQFVMERQKNNDATKQDSNINKTSQPTVAMAKSASVTFVKGDVTYMEDETADPVVLETTSKVDLEEGGMIKTGSEALAIIMMPDQSVLRLNADTEVVLTEMSTSETTITNSMGQVYARVASSSKPFNTVIDDAMFSSLGTAYMSVNTEDMQTVDVYEGSVKKSTAEKTTAMSNSNKYVLGEEEVIISQGYRYYLRYRNEEKKNDTLEKLTQEEVSQNEFANWNLKEDIRTEKYDDDLGVLDDLIGQYVVILSPRDGATIADSTAVIKGRADESFNLTLNGKEIKNNNGSFSGTVDLKVGNVDDLNGKSILDLGCGVGDFYGFLKSRNYEVEYMGIDLLPEMIEEARNKYLSGNFYLKQIDQIEDEFDYIFASGAFSYRVENYYEKYMKIIKTMFNNCKLGIAFNMLKEGKHVDDDAFITYSPTDIMESCEAFASNVRLIENYLEYDFTVVVRE